MERAARAPRSFRRVREGGSPMQVKYRSFTPGLNPRRIKLEVPGWGGERQPRKTGSMEQAWHCLPFSEGARYGIECPILTKTSFASVECAPRGGQVMG